MALTVHLLPLIVLSIAALACCKACSPLLLTPLLDQQKIKEARQLSEVKDPAGIIPKSYSGLLTADKTLGNHLFFWFFPSAQDPNAPVVVWLNGGPGVPSMFGLLHENGPIQIKNLPDRDVSYDKREHSWSDVFSMLYIDNPVEVGYSYTESGETGYRTTQDGYSSDLYNFMEQFYIMFPEYLDNQLYLGGQSYAGKYISAMAYRIHQEIETGKSKIPLTGIYLGGPLFDPETASGGLVDFAYALGAISYAQVESAKEAQAELFENLIDNDTVPSMINQIMILLGGFGFIPQDNYVTREKAPYKETIKLMSSESFRTALHVGRGCEFKVFHPINEFFKYDVAATVKDKLAVLMDNYKVLIYNGEFDAKVTSNGIEDGLLSTPWSLQAQYNASQKSMWYTEDRNRLLGFYQHVGQFCRVVIRDAGHQTPYNQPEITLEMIRRFVEHGCINED